MSGTIQDALANLVGITIRRPRAIGTIIPHVVAEEENADETVITDHPVERGAPISDHAYMAPRIVQMKCAWSNSNQFDTFGETYIDDVYRELQDLQEAREPFELITGKRAYPAMLLQSLSVSTDASSENALAVVARFREVIIVSTQSTTVPPREEQAEPDRTEAPVDRGEVQPEAAPEAAQQAEPPAQPAAEQPISAQDSAPRPAAQPNDATQAAARDDLASFRDRARASLAGGNTSGRL